MGSARYAKSDSTVTSWIKGYASTWLATSGARIRTTATVERVGVRGGVQCYDAGDYSDLGCDSLTGIDYQSAGDKLLWSYIYCISRSSTNSMQNVDTSRLTGLVPSS